MTGLAFAVAAQALVAPVLVGRSTGLALVGGALVAGFAIGIRSQTFLLTLPLLAAALALPRPGIAARPRWRRSPPPPPASSPGAIPLIVASGGLGGLCWRRSGPRPARTSRRRDAMDDAPRARRRRRADVFVPLAVGIPSVGWIAVAVADSAPSASSGARRGCWSSSRSGSCRTRSSICSSTKVNTVRYALPLVVPIAWLIVAALELGGRAAVGAGVAALAATLVLTVPASVGLRPHASPDVPRVWHDVEAALTNTPAGRPTPASACMPVARRVAEWKGDRLARPRPESGARPRVADARRALAQPPGF